VFRQRAGVRLPYDRSPVVDVIVFRTLTVERLKTQFSGDRLWESNKAMAMTPAEEAKKIDTFFREAYGVTGTLAAPRRIVQVGRRLKRPLPPVLRELYLLRDGFRRPSGEDPWLLEWEHFVSEASYFSEYASGFGESGFICFGFCEGWRHFCNARWGKGADRAIWLDAK
jgi:hypothetical protein